MLNILGAADSGDSASHAGPFADHAGQHIHFVLVGHCNQQIGMGNAGVG